MNTMPSTQTQSLRGTVEDTDEALTRLCGARDDISLSIVVPCFNEEKNIYDTLQSITAALADSGRTYEIAVVDDASKDGTSDAARRYVEDTRDDRIRLYRNAKNIGLARVFVTGVYLSRGKYYRLVCGDNVESPDQLREIFSYIGKADMVIPYHVTVANKHPVRRLVSKTFVFLVNTVTGNNLKYYNGITVFRRLDVMLWPPETTSFSFQAELVTKLLALGASYVEVPIHPVERLHGSSSAVSMHNILSGCYTLFRLFARRVAARMFGQKGHLIDG